MKVLLFACIEKNIGDDLFIHCICSRYSKIDFYIDSKAKYGDLREISNLHFSRIFRIWNVLSNTSSSKQVINLLVHFCKKIMDCLLIHKRVGVYIVGNAFKNEEYVGKIQTEWLRNRIQLVDEFYLLSTNFGPYRDERWRRDCQEVFSNMKDVCFREEDSCKLFPGITNVRYAPDAVFSLGSLKGNKKGNTAIISMIDCNRYEANRKDGLHILTEYYEKKLSEIADHLQEKKYEVILLTSNDNQDKLSADRIYKYCRYNDRVKAFHYTGNYKAVLKLYQDTKLVIGTRLHTIILAFLYNIPVFPVIYDIKVRNILESYNFTGKSIEIQKINEVDVKGLIKYLREQYKAEINVEKCVELSEGQFFYLDQELKFEESKSGIE